MFIKIHIKFKLYDVLGCLYVDGHHFWLILGYGSDDHHRGIIGMKTETTANELLCENDARGYCRHRSK